MLLAMFLGIYLILLPVFVWFYLFFFCWVVAGYELIMVEYIKVDESSQCAWL